VETIFRCSRFPGLYAPIRHFAWCVHPNFPISKVLRSMLTPCRSQPMTRRGTCRALRSSSVCARISRRP